MALTLYSYWRSSAAWRVRLALNLKGLDYSIHPVHLLEGGGQQFSDDYRAISPESLVPSLAHDDWSLSQSLAICEYLEQTWPRPRLLPDDARSAATVRSFCALIACDTHPLNNLRVLKYLGEELKADEAARSAWYRHWIARAFAGLEARVAGRTTVYAFGDEPGLAECFLIPQMYNARRFDCPLDDYPGLCDIDARCADLPAFIAAHPDAQIDRPA